LFNIFEGLTGTD